MISGISKKIIFFSFLFINFIQPSISAELSKINRNINNRNIKISLSNESNLENTSNSLDNPFSNDFEEDRDNVKFLKKKKIRFWFLKPTSNKS